MKAQFNRSKQIIITVLAALFLFSGAMQAQTSKPNILVIFGDDISFWNVKLRWWFQ